MDGVWQEFTVDPRVEDNARVRASDADREVVRQVLANAYAEGRLDLDEFEERNDQVSSTRTLGELPDVIDDLVVTRGSMQQAASGEPARMTPDERAVDHFAAERKQALWAFIAAPLICWVIWFVTSWGSGGFDAGFPWPVFVMLGTGVNLGRVLFMRNEIVTEERQRLERKEAKRLRKRGDSQTDSPG